MKDLGSLVDSKNRLKFGTAGLRGAMGAGYNCMNDLVVLQTSQGLLKYICDTIGSEDGNSNSQQTKIAGIKAQVIFSVKKVVTISITIDIGYCSRI